MLASVAIHLWIYLKKGFLDGIPGFIYSINMSIYEYFIQLKMNESKKVHNSNN